MSQIIHSAVRYQIYRYNPAVDSWLYVTAPTEDKEAARDDFIGMCWIYPEDKFRLVRIENVTTVIEGSGGKNV